MLYRENTVASEPGVLEEERLNALTALNLLDTAPDPRFDRVTRLAAKVAETPIALISLVDEYRQWFKSRVGLDVCETERSIAFCHYGIQQSDPLIVPDARLDARFKENPLVTGAPHIQFYAGFPLKLASGDIVGTLCVIDTQPRILSTMQQEVLSDLAGIAVDEMELRKDVQQSSIEAQVAQQSIESVRQTRNFFRSIMDTCSEAIATYQPMRSAAGDITDFILTDCNAAACRMRGSTRDDMIGRTLTELVANIDQETIEKYRTVVETGESLEFDLHYVDSVYDDWFRMSVARHADGGLVLLTTVITDQKRAELRLRRSRDALSAFTAAVSHDLRTPLGHIAGFVQLIEEELEGQLNDQTSEFMGYVIDGVEQMRRLIDAMQKHARLGQVTIDRCSVDLKSLIGEVTNRFEQEMTDVGGTFNLGALPEIEADKVLLDQLFSNLIGNSIRYRAADRPLEIQMTATSDEKGATLYIADNGCGIAPDIREKVFSLFVRGMAHEEGDGGLGIGLATCRSIANAHGGSINVDADYQDGTRFILQLPSGSALTKD